MNWIRKNIGWVLYSLVLVLVLALVAQIWIQENRLCFAIDNGSGIDIIKIVEGEDNTCYVFLPSYAKMDQVYVSLGANENVMIDQTVLTDGIDCSQFALNTAYSFRDTNGRDRTLMFCKSADVPTLYINTVTNSMRHINADKDYKEIASIKVLNSDGCMDYYDAMAEISGRGNSTWDQEKRPYALKLSEESELLGMGNAINWVLLANSFDGIYLKNKVAFEIARKVKMNWSPECCFVDVYLNGEYNGLYLLAERVEIGGSRLNIDPQAGDFLCKIELNERIETLSDPIITNAGRTVEAITSKYNASITKKEMTDKINEMESALLSGGDLNDIGIIDLDSWVYRYLIDEISWNIDADLASSYFYYKNGVFYAGPVWDYDLSFSQQGQGQCFFANQYARSNDDFRIYYGALYKNRSFYIKVVDAYENVFLPVLEELLSGGIDGYASEINAASVMDGLRWSKKLSAIDGAKILTEFLQNRISFLNSAWIDCENLHTVQIEVAANQNYEGFTVKDGDCLKTNKVDLQNTVWVVKETGVQFDPNMPIHTDLILIKKNQDMGNTVYQSDNRVVIVWMSIICSVVLGALFIFLDVYIRKKERELINEP